MRQLIKNHYILTKKRGLITPSTSIHHFMDKMEDRYNEIINCYADDLKAEESPSGEFFHQCTDLLLTITDLLQHYSVDLTDEIRKANRIQEGRFKIV